MVLRDQPCCTGAALVIEYWERKVSGAGTGTISNLQALRAFAAINVVVYHSINTTVGYGHKVPLSGFMEGWGRCGVDIFFVISGFVMAWTQTGNPKTPREFLTHRAVRILPIYWALTLVYIGSFLVAPSSFREFRPDPVHIVGSFLFISDLIYGDHPILAVGWTLEYEMLFYALFAIGIELRRRWAIYLVPAVALLILAIAGTAMPIVVEFFFGLVCAKLCKDGRAARAGAVALASGCALLAIRVPSELGWDRVAWFGLPSFLIVFGALNCRQIGSRALIYLGDASYSVYLVQVFTIAAVVKAAGKLSPNLPGDALVIAATIATVALGCVVYQYGERPLTQQVGRLARGGR